MVQPSPDPEADDDRAALAAFAQSLPRETVASKQERREAGSLRIKQARREVLVCSLCVGACTATAALLLRPLPLLPSAQIAAGVVIGAIAGGFALPLLVLFKRVRLEVLIPEEERLDPAPFFQWNAPLGAIGGSLLTAAITMKRPDGAVQVAFTWLLLAAVLGSAAFLLASRASKARRRVP